VLFTDVGKDYHVVRCRWLTGRDVQARQPLDVTAMIQQSRPIGTRRRSDHYQRAFARGSARNKESRASGDSY